MKKYSKPAIRIIYTETGSICGASLMVIGNSLSNPTAESNRRGYIYDEDFYYFDEE